MPRKAAQRTTHQQSPIATPPAVQPETRRTDALCVLAILIATLAVYAPALFTGRVLLPADIVPLMRPWAATAHERFPDFRIAQNQLHGPIFEYYSWRHYARERLRAGEVPLWNPYELGGNVLLANNQSAVLYPLNLLLYVLPLWVGINAVTALHTFLTGLFMYGLLRSLRLRAPAALAGALVWMLCGVQIVWTEFQTPTAALCWLPAALWAWERYLQSGRARWAVLGGGVALGMALLAGHMQFAFYVVLGLGAYAAARTLASGTDRRRWLARLGVLAATVGFGAALAMCSLLPVLEMGRMNFRAAHTDYGSSIALRLPPANLLTLFQPDLFGNPRDYAYVDDQGKMQPGQDYFGAFNYVEFTTYVGMPALVLAVVGTGAAVRRRRAKGGGAPDEAFGVVAALGLLLALGTPLCLLLFYGVPGYRQFNATARAVSLFSFGLAALAAYGLNDLLAPRDEAEARSVRRWVVGGAVAVCALAVAAFPGTGPLWPRVLSDLWLGYETRELVHGLGLAAGAGALGWGLLSLRSRAVSSTPWILAALCALDLLTWGWGFNPATDPAMLGYATATTDFLQRAYPDRVVSLETPGTGIKSFIVPNYNAVCHIREAQGADSLHTWRFDHLMGRVVKAMGSSFADPNTLHYPSIDHPIFDLLNVRYVTTTADRTLPGPRYRPAAAEELVIWENTQAFGRAWVVGNTEQSRGVDQAFERLSSPGFDGRTTALVEGPVGRLSPVAAGSPVTVAEVAPHRVRATVDARGPGLAVFSETYFPGWRATVDGKPAPIVPADYILRGVPVPAGRHEVEMTYRPTSYLLGLYITATALGGLAAACVAQRARAQRSAR